MVSGFVGLKGVSRCTVRCRSRSEHVSQSGPEYGSRNNGSKPWYKFCTRLQDKTLEYPECIYSPFHVRVLGRHPGGNQEANFKSTPHRCYLREVAFEWELTKKNIYLPLGCLQGGMDTLIPAQA